MFSVCVDFESVFVVGMVVGTVVVGIRVENVFRIVSLNPSLNPIC